jgi:uncharacterized protein YjiK
MKSEIFSVGAALLASAVVGSAGMAQGINLSQYSLQSTHALDPVLGLEASAVTYNPDRNSLFVLGDEGLAVLEVDFAGNTLSSMALTGFADTEALTYIGGGQFVIGEERLQDVYRFTYAPGTSITRSAMPTISIGANIGNIGLEGMSFDPRDGSFITVKEKTPQLVQRHMLDFTAGTTVTTNVFTPALNVLDLSDVQVLSTIPSLAGTAAADNLLILSQESNLLMVTDRAGTVLSSFSVAGLSLNTEGVTILPDGRIVLVAESFRNAQGITVDLPTMFVLVPSPSAAGLLGLGAAAMLRRRR